MYCAFGNDKMVKLTMLMVHFHLFSCQNKLNLNYFDHNCGHEMEVRYLFMYATFYDVNKQCK